MITDTGKYYVYRYIRLDKNQPFYIGIGTKTSTDEKYGTYARARAKKNQNPIWESIVNKSSYEIEILVESNNYDYIKSKEKEFIKLYGRIDKGSGTLANMTDGGDGTIGIIVSNKAREKRSQVHLGRKYTDEQKKEAVRKRIKTMRDAGYIMPEEKRNNISIKKAQPIVQLTLDGQYVNTYPSIRMAVKESGRTHPEISSSLHSKKTCAGGGYVWEYEYKLKNGITDKIYSIVDKYLQNEGIRKSKISLNEKIEIIKESDEMPVIGIKLKAKTIAEKRKMKSPIVEYYIKNRQTLIKRKERYDEKINKFNKLLKEYQAVENNPTKYTEINERRKKLLVKYGYSEN